MSDCGTADHWDEHENFQGGGEKESGGGKNPACDNCRAKKIRCGREKPSCKSCVVGKWKCTYSERQKRDSEATRTAQRFDEVHERLDRIEGCMNRLVSALEGANPSRPPPSEPPDYVHALAPAGASPADSTASAPARLQLQYQRPKTVRTGRLGGGKKGPLPFLKTTDGVMSSQYLGPSSTLHVTNEAESLVEERIRKKYASKSQANKDDNANANAILEVEKLSDQVMCAATFYGHTELRNGAAEVTMCIPSKEEAEDLLEVYYQKMHDWMPIFGKESFRRDLECFYNDIDKGIKDRAWMCCFYNMLLFGAYQRMQGMPKSRGQHKLWEAEGADMKGITRDRIHGWYYSSWRELDDLEVYLAPRLLNVQALLSASIVAIEVSRPGLCWSLLSGAARLAQAIGLHRTSPADSKRSETDKDERRGVFWNIYILDKALSLTFGRPTCVPDFDCDVPIPEEAEGNSLESTAFVAMIYLAKIQSSIYVRLYSASAFRHPDSERETAIRELDRELRIWRDYWEKLFVENTDVRKDPMAETGPHAPKAPTSFQAIDLRFGYYISLVLVHRMARPGMSCAVWSDAECLKSARASVEVVNDGVSADSTFYNSGKVIWLFQYYPFTSFFTLFSAVVRDPAAPESSSVDYPLMKSLTAYLSSVSSTSKAAQRLLSIASAFTQLAGKYLSNYHKQSKGENPAADGRKRRRSRTDIGFDNRRRAPAQVAEENEDESDEKAERVYKSGYGQGFYRTAVFPTEATEQFVYVDPDSSSSSTESIPPPPQDGLNFDSDLDVSAASLQAANFLRWPASEPPMAASDQPIGTRPYNDGESGAGPGMELDLEMMVNEPMGFQMQMEAARGGSLDFDWFSWDGHYN